MRWPPLLSGKNKKTLRTERQEIPKVLMFFLYIPGDLVVLVTCASWIDYANPTKPKQKLLPNQGRAGTWLELTRLR
jgi:hypothetical protein